MAIKVFASCESNEIPTEYRFSLSGIYNVRNTGMIAYWRSIQLLETQTLDGIDSSELNCDSQTIDEPCTLQPGLTWRREEMNKKSAVSVKARESGLAGKIVQTLTLH